MLNSMLPFSMLSSCRCYSFDDNFFEVDVPVFDVSYFSQEFMKLTLDVDVVILIYLLRKDIKKLVRKDLKEKLFFFNNRYISSF